MNNILNKLADKIVYLHDKNEYLLNNAEYSKYSRYINAYVALVTVYYEKYNGYNELLKEKGMFKNQF